MLKLPPKIYDQHIAVLGKTRSGKSSAMRWMVEHLLDANRPVCIVDPKGDWWGLKSSKTGKSAGYPVVIFGGEHGDVPLNAQSGAHVAELIATGNRPCIIDLGGWRVGERTRWFIDFAQGVFRATRGTRHLVIDEAHNFAPQGKILSPEAGEMLHWANRLASEGSGKGLTLIAATQRPQKIHKDFLTCCETLVALRVVHPLDRGATKEWIDGCSDVEKGKEVLASLAVLQRGEAWIWSPEIGYGPVRDQFPLFKTYDSFAAQANTGAKKLKGWASVDLDEVRAKLAAVVEEAEANDPKKLRAHVRDLEKQLRDLKKRTPEAVADVTAIAGAVSRAILDRDREWQSRVKSLYKLRDTLAARLEKIKSLADTNGAESVDVTAPPEKAAVYKNSHNLRTKKHTKTAGGDRATGERQPVSANVGDGSSPRLGKGHRLILDTLAWFDSIGEADPGWQRVCAVAGRHPNTKGMTNARGELRSAGLLDDCRLTEAGAAAATAPDIEPTLAGLHDALRRRLKGREREIFDLVVSYGGRINQAELAEIMKLHPNTKSFTNARGRLASTFGLIEYDGSGDDREIVGTDLMYPEGLS